MWIAASTPLRISQDKHRWNAGITGRCQREGVRLFLQVSTDEVMGSLPEDENAYFTEASPLAPNNPYAASKAAAEHLVRRPITLLDSTRSLRAVETTMAPDSFRKS